MHKKEVLFTVIGGIVVAVLAMAVDSVLPVGASSQDKLAYPAEDFSGD